MRLGKRHGKREVVRTAQTDQFRGPAARQGIIPIDGGKQGSPAATRPSPPFSLCVRSSSVSSDIGLTKRSHARLKQEAVTDSPLWNVAPSTRLKVNVRASSEAVMLRAAAGVATPSTMRVRGKKAHEAPGAKPIGDEQGVDCRGLADTTRHP